MYVHTHESFIHVNHRIIKHGWALIRGWAFTRDTTVDSCTDGAEDTYMHMLIHAANLDPRHGDGQQLEVRYEHHPQRRPVAHMLHNSCKITHTVIQSMHTTNHTITAGHWPFSEQPSKVHVAIQNLDQLRLNCGRPTK